MGWSQEHYAKRYPQYNRTCVECGAVFNALHMGSRRRITCSRACSEAHVKKVQRENPGCRGRSRTSPVPIDTYPTRSRNSSHLATSIERGTGIGSIAAVRIPVPDDKWDVIGRIAALEGMDVAVWVEDFVVQQMRIVLETAKQEVEMDETEFGAWLGSLDVPSKARHQAVRDAYIAELMATYDFDGLLAMHERSFS